VENNRSLSGSGAQQIIDPQGEDAADEILVIDDEVADENEVADQMGMLDGVADSDDDDSDYNASENSDSDGGDEGTVQAGAARHGRASKRT
jgi:hypothetical protein